MPILFVLFIVVPILEIALLIQVGNIIGGWTTIAIVVITAILGTYMLRQQGLATLVKAQQRMGQGEMPAQQILEGIFLLIGGVLLLTPGFMTDAVGFTCLIPVSRAFLAKKLSKSALGGGWVMSGNGGSWSTGAGVGTPPPNAASPKSGKPVEGKVIDGDYERLD